jgi:hypothetical protein
MARTLYALLLSPLLIGVGCMPSWDDDDPSWDDDDDDDSSPADDDDTAADDDDDTMGFMPDIVVDPNPIELSGAIESATETALFIRNVGDFPLNVSGLNLMDNEGGLLQCATWAGQLMPGEAEQIDHAVTANCHEVGIFTDGMLRVDSDDPDEPALDVPIIVECLGPA